MIIKRNIYAIIIALTVILTSCSSDGEHSHANGEHHDESKEHIEGLHITKQQFKAMEIKVDTIPLKNISAYVEANGQLEVPPQNIAEVTAIIGANVTDIRVIEGNKVAKGDVLAYLSHPNLIKIQTDYVGDWNRLQYLEKEYNRQKKLYDEKVGSGKEFQETESNYKTLKAEVKGQEIQLKQLNLRIENIRKSELYEKVPVISPINGYVQHVEVKLGQFVQPQTEMFEVVNIEHIHADLMVFESDMHKVKIGQKVIFNIQSQPGEELEAEIHTIGKAFEQNPKAIHLHAEIHSKKGLLLPGMYINGRIQTEDIKSLALPESAVVREGDKYVVFTAMKDNESNWTFKPIEVNVGSTDNGWMEVKFLQSTKPNTLFAMNNAYYLLAEMKKGEAEHEH